MDITYECCRKMGYELAEKHIYRLQDGRWFLECGNPIKYCPFCGILLTTKM